MVYDKCPGCKLKGVYNRKAKPKFPARYEERHLICRYCKWTTPTSVQRYWTADESEKHSQYVALNDLFDVLY